MSNQSLIVILSAVVLVLFILLLLSIRSNSFNFKLMGMEREAHDRIHKQWMQFTTDQRAEIDELKSAIEAKKLKEWVECDQCGGDGGRWEDPPPLCDGCGGRVPRGSWLTKDGKNFCDYPCTPNFVPNRI